MKPLFWIGNSYRVLTDWAAPVKQVAGFQLHLIQEGMNPDDWKPMTSIGAGVREVRIHVDGEYRIIYLTKFDEGIYILHAFPKKTQKTPKKDIDIAKARLREVIQMRAEA
jgi:phage-related protein